MKTPARTLMVQGTASGVGKSWLATALCRLLLRRGFRVAPFKAQNMSNNSAVTSGGGEIGRAQAVQAAAAGLEPDERMNPVLLKPMGDQRSDVVVMGRSRPDLAEVPWMERRALLWPAVTEALDSLRREMDWVVIEGAGSPAEVNLRAADLVNMSVAHHAGSPVLLVADIDRGGAFAAALGTWHLLDRADRGLLRGFVLNRFRGDPELLGDAPAELARRTGLPILGVIPWVPHRLPEEDAAELDRRRRSEGCIGVIRLPRIANFDDVLPLETDPSVGVRWVAEPADLVGVAAVVIPGTRNTAADLAWLHARGLADALHGAVRIGMPLLGICGGLQMLGEVLEDPHGIESGGTMEGLGLLPLHTAMGTKKRVRTVRVRWENGLLSDEFDGYEIHHGRTRPTGAVDEFMWTADPPGSPVGFRKGKVWGSYVHGCMNDAAFRAAWLEQAGVRGGTEVSTMEAALDAVADVTEAALDIDAILEERP